MSPIGDPLVWSTALRAEEVEKDDVQGVANSVVRHVTTTLARQAINMDEVGGHVGSANGKSLQLTRLLLSPSRTSFSSELLVGIY